MAESKRYDLIVNTSVVVTVVAIGVVVAGVLQPQNDAVAQSDSDAPLVVTKPVAYPVDIPGCDVVEPSPSGGEATAFSISTVGGGEESYDDPTFPWLTSGKAAVMSAAVRGALPSDVTIRLAAPSQSLIFQPVMDYGDDAPEQLVPATNATGELVRADSTAFTSIVVAPSDTGAPACVAGSLDSRAVEPDGTIVDTLDSWYEIGGARTYSRNATAYHPDGTRVTLSITGGNSDALPLQPVEAARIVALPDLSVTVPAQTETAAPRQDCSVHASDDGTVRDIRQESVDAANDALAATWAAIPNAPVLDEPIGSLVPGGFGSGVCADLGVAETSVGLSVSVVGGQPLPAAVDPYDPSSAYEPLPETRTLPDGSVLQSSDIDYTAMMLSDNGTRQLTRSVTFTRPSGVQVSVRSTADIEPRDPAAVSVPLPDPLPLDLLEALAQSPIAAWP